ncbi:hypothetical protein [Paraburkholderia graminis]|nr:hypothetical protein [Paraburkholderia graminis]
MNEFLDPERLELKEPTLPEAIEQINRDLASFLEFTNISHEKYRSTATVALCLHPEDPAAYLSEQFPTVTGDAFRRHYLARACIEAIYAEQALQNLKGDSAWYRVSVAQRQIGLFEGSYSDPFSSKERVEFASLGGQARGRKTEPVRAELVRLLNKLRPHGGWVDESEVIKAVAIPLFQFSQTNGGYLKESSFKQTIRRWLQDREHKDIQAAFRSSAR